MINRCVLVGRLTSDPTLRYTPSGVAVTTFNLAVDRQFKNQNGEREADFIQIVVWRQLAELCANYLKKGSQCAVEGRLQSRSFNDKDGKKRFVVEVVADNTQFLDTKKSENNQDPFKNENTVDIDDDDLPF